jgi:hypothetical protein
MNLGKFAVNRRAWSGGHSSHGGFEMKQRYLAAALGTVLIGSAFLGAAMAAPPTVVPSPGYDARLQEQRAASQAAEAPKPAYIPRRKPKPHHSVPR